MIDMHCPTKLMELVNTVTKQIALQKSFLIACRYKFYTGKCFIITVAHLTVVNLETSYVTGDTLHCRLFGILLKFGISSKSGIL